MAVMLFVALLLPPPHTLLILHATNTHTNLGR
jgi:hypothetical protein